MKQKTLNYKKTKGVFMKHNNKLNLILIALGLVFFVSGSIAQNFTMNAGATYNATCNAVIKMKNSASQFDGAATGATFATAAVPIQGVVDWAASTGAQTIQGLHYQYMIITGAATKNIQTGVFITGLNDATCGFFTGYTGLATYPYQVTAPNAVNYAGTFNFSGLGSQNIWDNGQAGGGTYNILNLTGSGDKTVLAADAVTIGSQLTSDAGTNLDIEGDLTLGTGSSTLAGTVSIDDPLTGPANLVLGTGALALNGNVTVGSGALTAGAGAGAVTVGTGANLGLTGNTSVLSFADATNLIITGTITNGGNGTNLNFACLSTVTYNGAAGQLVLPVISTNSYGNLILSNGLKNAGTAGYGDDFYLCNDFTLNGGGNFNLFASVPTGGVLYMTAEDAVVTYAANEEVVGKMNRVTSGTPTAAYVFNNAQTIVTLATDADNPTSIQLDVRPGAVANPYNYNATKDVDRKINLTYTGNPGSFEWTARAGYLLSEGPGGWGGVYTQASVRFYESDNVATDDEKVGTGEVYSRLAAAGANLGYVQLGGIANTATTAVPNGIGLFASTNDLKLTAGPTTFYSVQNGRWTNPNTWDEGTVPTAIDDAEIRNIVYVGIDGPFVNTPGGANDVDVNNTKAELDHYGAGIAAANTITIANNSFESPTNNVALVIGNEDNGNGYVFKTSLTGAVSFSNENATASGITVTSLGAKASYELTGAPGFRGLFLTTYGNSGTQLSNFSTFQLLNAGSINNMGIIELGE